MNERKADTHWTPKSPVEKTSIRFSPKHANISKDGETHISRHSLMAFFVQPHIHGNDGEDGFRLSILVIFSPSNFMCIDISCSTH